MARDHDGGVDLAVAPDAADLASLDELVLLALLEEPGIGAGELEDVLGRRSQSRSGVQPGAGPGRTAAAPARRAAT